MKGNGINLSYKSYKRLKSAHHTGVYQGSSSMMRIGVFLLPLDEMLVYRRAKFASSYLYTWVERDTVRVKCLDQEHNTMSPARARTQTARSGDERTKYETTSRYA